MSDEKKAQDLDKLIPGENKRTTARDGGSRTFDAKGVEMKSKPKSPKKEGGEE